MPQASIYQQLWDLDLQHNGCTVSARAPSGAWLNEDADLKLDEQQELTGPAVDVAPNPLFAESNAGKLEGATYQAFKSLLNNYVFNARLTEDHLGDNQVEDEERQAFLDSIMATEVMQCAHEYVSGRLEFDLSEADFRSEVERLWFDIYTNHYQNNAVAFCSGFEHIVVGESKGNPSSSGIGGYHSWTKYLYDQLSGRVDFKGFNYDNKFNRIAPVGATVPHVATISFSFTPLSMDGEPMARKRKNLGGFFVGPSPECQIAMPVVAYFESLRGEFFVGNGTTSRERTEKRVEIHDAIYHLVLYMETKPDQTRGNRLRSFFPKFMGLSSGTMIDRDTHALSGQLTITAILSNPVNPESGREWVELENSTDAIIDLNGWTMRDHHDRVEHLHGSIEPTHRVKFPITRTAPNTMQLTNSGGTVMVFDPNGRLVAKTDYPGSQNGEVMFFE